MVLGTTLAATPPAEFRFKLSSKHIMLASPVARKMYSPPWIEKLKRERDGLLPCPMDPSFDPDAFTIVMNVIHGRNRNVPRDVDLETLAKIAVITNFLQCYESMEVFSGIWIGALQSSLPDTCGRELVLWIMISSIFYNRNIFSSTTRTAILRSNGKIPDFDLPIHENIVRKFSESRNIGVV